MWTRRAFYVLPALVATLFVVILLALWLAGAECTGKDSGEYGCNGVGDVYTAVLYGGLLITALSLVVWAVGMLVVGARRLRSRLGGRST